jgi:Ran GTPase-activating protein (RanGAP) involved in mRNA processing and transport
MKVIQGCGATLSKCLGVLPESLHPLVLSVHFPDISKHAILSLGRSTFANSPSSSIATVLQPLFKASEAFTTLREISIAVPYAGSQLITNDSVVQSFQDALCKMRALNTLIIRPGFLTHALPIVISQALPHLGNLRTLVVSRQVTWRSLGCKELHQALAACTGLRHLHFSRIDCDWASRDTDEHERPSHLASALMKMTLLRSLTLSCGSVNVNVLKDVRALLPSSQLIWLPMLSDLNLSSNFACWDSKYFAEDVAPVLSRLPNLRRIDVSDNNISAEGAEALAPAFQQLTNLQFINVSLNNMFDRGAAAFAASWTGLINLEHLFMADCGLSASGGISLSNALSCFRNLQYLNLNGMFLVDATGDISGARALSQALSTHCNLQHLMLRSASLTADAITVLAPQIVQHTNLRCLDLQCNPNIDSRGVIALAEHLRTLTRLQVFRFGERTPWNAASAEAATALSSALQSLTGLRTLDLSRFRTTQAGNTGLSRSFSGLVLMEELDLSACNMNRAAAAELATSMSSMVSLKRFHLDSNPIGDDGAVALAPALACLPQIRLIDLSNTQITERGATAVVTALGGHECISSVDLRLNGFETESVPELLGKRWVRF